MRSSWFSPLNLLSFYYCVLAPTPNTTVVDDTLVDLNDSNQEYTLGSAKSGGSLNRLNCTSLSGYLNKVMTVPEDVSTLDKAGVSRHRRRILPL